MTKLSRRELLCLALASSANLTGARTVLAQRQPADLHQQLLDLAARQQQQRREQFAAVTTPAELAALQKSLRDDFLRLLGGLPTSSAPPPAHATRVVEADGYSIEKLVFESSPGYFVPALLYRPKAAGLRPAVISPCGHSAVGKAADAYQILHINLARRGFFVLTYDPVGQGERSQFWDAAKSASRFNLVCGEHAVLGNPLYLLGTSLARYRIWDGMRGYRLPGLAAGSRCQADRLRWQFRAAARSRRISRPSTPASLQPQSAAISRRCPRRMANRIEKDPDADPEQDIFGFVSGGIDHAGLLALRAPKPTLLGGGAVRFLSHRADRESFAEARKLFEVAGAADRIAMAEAPGKHGLSLPLRRPPIVGSTAGSPGQKVTRRSTSSRSRPGPQGIARRRERASQHLVEVASALAAGLGAIPRAACEGQPPLSDSRAAGSRVGRLPPGRDRSRESRATRLWSSAPTATSRPIGRNRRGCSAALAAPAIATATVDPRGVGSLRPSTFRAEWPKLRRSARRRRGKPGLQRLSRRQIAPGHAGR